MNILLTNHSLEHVGGTEKWTYAMGREMARRGFNVDVSTLMEGETSRRMAPFARVSDKPQRAAYDLIMANHPATTFWVHQAVEGFKIFTSHGPSHRLETPVSGADVYVAVSKEVRATRLADGFRAGPWEVITNGVDLEEFYPGEKRPKHVLVACKDATAGNIAIEAAIRNGCTWDAVHYLSQPTWDMSEKMRDADVVIGCGRTAIEGLASGCKVLVFDFRSKKHGPRTDGWIEEDNVEHLRQVNFSCRAYGRECDLDTLTGLLSAIPEEQDWQRSWAEQEADVQKKAQEYLDLMMAPERPEHAPDLTAEYEEINT